MSRNNRNRKLTAKELEHYAEHLSEISDLSGFSSGSSDLWEPSPENSDHENSVQDIEDDAEDANVEEEDSRSDNEGTIQNQIKNTHVIWSTVPPTFVPRKSIPAQRECAIPAYFTEDMEPFEVFYKIFPRSLFMYIAQCTNERLAISQKKAKGAPLIRETDIGEIKIVVGSMLIMSYNRLPALPQYWSRHPSMGNETIKKAISRDRFKLISSKLYFAPPEKPPDASKTYYIDNVVQCLKQTFKKSRQDSTFQSIDESMTKFKGRSSLKQYMPLKPTKRGIKMWLRCDSDSGYVYDFNIYTGRELGDQTGTLGERVVNALASTITEPDVALCFDRFFTSVTLLQSINYAAVGTCIASRRNIPKLSEKLDRSQSQFKCTDNGLLFAKWRDTKDVLVLSNCHTNTVTSVCKKNKQGEKVEVDCPEMIAFYREKMGGVDRADQMAGLYEFDRKSTKWWIKSFHRLVMMSAVNAWVIYKEVKGMKRCSFLDFIVPLAEALIDDGRKTASVMRGPQTGRKSRKRKSNEHISLHLPIEGETRRRCASCTQQKLQKRTKTLCKECQIPLCKNCFANYHM